MMSIGAYVSEMLAKYLEWSHWFTIIKRDISGANSSPGENRGYNKDVPWGLKVSPNLSESPHPTDKEIKLIRNFAPAQSAGRELALELTVTNMMSKAKKA